MRRDDVARIAHTVMMSIIFAATIPFLAISFREAVRHPAGLVTATLTLFVVACVYWWYATLGTAFPSRSIPSLAVDLAIGGGLCFMADSAGHWHSGPLVWTCAWGCVALFAALKATFGARPMKALYRPFVWWAAGTCWVTVLLAAYAALIAYQYQGLARNSAPDAPAVPVLLWVVTWVPVAAGIIVTLHCSLRWPRGERASEGHTAFTISPHTRNRRTPVRASAGEEGWQAGPDAAAAGAGGRGVRRRQARR